MPVAVTLKSAVTPAHTARLAGCVVMMTGSMVVVELPCSEEEEPRAASSNVQAVHRHSLEAITGRMMFVYSKRLDWLWTGFIGYVLGLR